MTETPVTVDAGDLHALICAFAAVDQSFRPFLGALNGYGEAREACGRLAAVLAQSAIVASLPPDPVAAADASAIGSHETMLAYERAGFTREEAFELTLAWVQATASAAMEKAMGGGQ